MARAQASCWHLHMYCGGVSLGSCILFDWAKDTIGPEGARFVVQVVPALSKLFASNDRTIRRSLLESIDTYGQHFSQVTHWL